MCELTWHSKHPHPWSGLLTDSASLVDWRRKFQQAWTDAKRTTISERELCELSWMVSFSSQWSGSVSRQGFFLLDGTYHNNKGQWSTSLAWKLSLGGSRVVLGSFEDLVVSRTASWGWRMQNDSSSYETFVPESEDNARALLQPPRFVRGLAPEEDEEHIEDSDGDDD
mmetsp:Transcript_73599/g.239578  ORF Transcript_73599/g.239578 Transcript_73599/m.239578 type:complete len:168 (+) Transcript_73599:201-704(+)